MENKTVTLDEQEQRYLGNLLFDLGGQLDHPDREVIWSLLGKLALSTEWTKTNA